MALADRFARGIWPEREGPRRKPSTKPASVAREKRTLPNSAGSDETAAAHQNRRLLSSQPNR